MDGKTPLVSVVMSVYNGGQWTKAAIESIVQQTYSNWEFIILDDASTDETKTILAAYNTDPRFKIITNKEKTGLTKNLNTGINAASGEFIARMDADDISMPGRFEQQVDFLVNNPEVSVISSFVELIDEKGNPAGTWKDDRAAASWNRIRKMLPGRNCLAHPTVMIRKNLFENYGYNEAQINSQDWDLWLQLAADLIVIEKLNYPLVLYRIHPESVTSGSLKKSGARKKHTLYKRYLSLAWQKKKINLFNGKVVIAFGVNFIELFFSAIKRIFKS